MMENHLEAKNTTPSAPLSLWMGRTVDALDIKPSDIHIPDIAFSLSNLCRWTGHVEFYSVAEHSLLVTDLLAGQPPLVQLWGLLHDGAEAFLGDIASPIKEHLPLIKSAEERALRAIAVSQDLPWPIPFPVLMADRMALAIEARAFDKFDPLEILDVTIPDDAPSPTLNKSPSNGMFRWIDRFEKIKEQV